MTYLEQQKLKAISLRDKLFHDHGNGLFMGKEREFVLSDPQRNLWEGIRLDAIDYFERNHVAWWRGNGPTGHLLSSQIACINHLYFIRQREDLATALLKNVDETIERALVVDDGFVEFEFIGDKNYLNERAHTRGANCTSVDAVMIGLTNTNVRKMFFIEWKYVEAYAPVNRYVPERAKCYDKLIRASDSPFFQEIDSEVFYYEPFYQLMRQTLLANECAKSGDHGTAEYLHLHVVPEGNLELRNRIASPKLHGRDIDDAWKNTLKNKDRFVATTPEELLRPLSKMKDAKSALAYLKERYWD